MAKAKNAEVVAGTLDGLFRLTNTKGWEKLNLPVENNRITDLSNKGDTLLVLTRDYLLKSVDLNHFDKIQLPAPINHKKQTSWFKLLWNLHSGELFGFLGKLFVDLLGVVVILLSITGLVHFFYPKLLNAEQRKNTTHRNTRKLNLKWHNIVGYVFVVFLMFNVIAGMFLRPPLLIAIAKAKVGVIPFTHLDSPNPWQDKLRKITWNQAIEKYVVSTSDGFYLLNENQQIIEKPNCMQPPVSVMGCNVLQQVDSTNYIVGSFSGLFSWDIVSGEIYDLGKNKPFVNSTKSGRPISGTMVSGIVYLNNANIWYSDYNKGMVQVTSKQRFVKMPKSVKNAPMSLWNFCLEVHTGRIFESILGGFYILYVPLAGICMLIVLISGFFLWYWVYRLQKKKQ